MQVIMKLFQYNDVTCVSQLPAHMDRTSSIVLRVSYYACRTMSVVVKVTRWKMNVNRNPEFCKILRFWKGNKKPPFTGADQGKGV